MFRLLEVHDVWKKYGKTWVLKGINLKINKNALVGIVGDNGSGKTTLLKIISGLIKPNKGRVKLFNSDIRENLNYKSMIGMLFHENTLYDELTVEENLNFYAKIYGLEKMSDIAAEIFKRMRLENYKDTKVKDLSHGMKRRVNLVRALINNPKIVLLDEPLSGLDEKSRKTVKKIMIELSNEKIIIFTSPTEVNIDCIKYKLINGVLVK